MEGMDHTAHKNKACGGLEDSCKVEHFEQQATDKVVKGKIYVLTEVVASSPRMTWPIPRRWSTAHNMPRAGLSRPTTKSAKPQAAVGLCCFE